STPPNPPNQDVVTGNLSIGGLPAPAGTLVQLFFDGKAGPAVRTDTVGVYRFEYGIGGANCASRPGAAVSVQVAGQAFPTDKVVGDVLSGWTSLSPEGVSSISHEESGKREFVVRASVARRGLY